MASRSMLAAIHVAKKELALDDDGYRDVLRRVADVGSAAQLDDRQANRVMDEFRRLGFTRVKGNAGGDARGVATTGPQRLIKSLWIGLGELNVLRDRSDAAMVAWIARQCGAESLRFVGPREARQLIEALKAWLEREGVDFADAWTGERLDPVAGRAAIVRAQWARLRDLGVVSADAPGAYLVAERAVRLPDPKAWTAAEGDAAIKRLGRRVRMFRRAEAAS